MTGFIARSLRCDGSDRDGRPCDVEIVAESGVTSLNALRAIAHREHGWRTRGGDYCPRHLHQIGGRR